MSIICDYCKGNGYLRLNFEAEEVIEQCPICQSQGELDENTYYHQSWEEGTGDNVSRAIYYGPPLDPEGFKNYKLHKE